MRIGHIPRRRPIYLDRYRRGCGAASRAAPGSPTGRPLARAGPPLPLPAYRCARRVEPLRSAQTGKEGAFEVERFDIVRDLTERTGGSIYIGVVGPVRTGKSTLIKRFMELLMLPNIADEHVRRQTQDELPQSGAGRSVMTTQPHFVPDEPVQVHFGENLRVRVRLVDCVGYGVEGARGFDEMDGPRMVRTPWSPEEVPFEEAAEIGTRRVIVDHSTVGLVVLTDGSITDIPRSAYLPAEDRVINELQSLGKPFTVLLNSRDPSGRRAQEAKIDIEKRHNVRVHPVNCLEIDEEGLLAILREALMEFPVREVGVHLPSWVEALDLEHPLVVKHLAALRQGLDDVKALRDVDRLKPALESIEEVRLAELTDLDLGAGKARIRVSLNESLFYQTLGELTGFEISGDHDLVRLMRELAVAKRTYDRMAEALQSVDERGYGVVAPELHDIQFEDPEITRKGSQFGIRLTASAPTIHMVRADITTEVTPYVGTDKQGEELARYLVEEFEEDPEKAWKSDFLGKSLQDLIREGIRSKLDRMPEHAQQKFRETLTKILNEGSGGLICIIL